jgi:uncharacterized protein with GYD domain
MATYISLINFTEQGIGDIKNAPKRTSAAKKLAASMRGKVKAIYLTMGGYDIVAISEFPNGEAAAKFALTLGAQGNVRTTTLTAFSEAEYRKIVSSLP